MLSCQYVNEAVSQKISCLKQRLCDAALHDYQFFLSLLKIWNCGQMSESCLLMQSVVFQWSENIDTNINNFKVKFWPNLTIFYPWHGKVAN